MDKGARNKFISKLIFICPVSSQSSFIKKMMSQSQTDVENVFFQGFGRWTGCLCRDGGQPRFGRQHGVTVGLTRVIFARN